MLRREIPLFYNDSDLYLRVNEAKADPDLVKGFPVNRPVPYDKQRMIKAIEYGMILILNYSGDEDPWRGGRERVVCPMVLGVNRNTRNTLLRGWHLDGWSVSENRKVEKVWRLFKTDNIKTMMFTGDFFRLPPRGYRMNDRVMTETTIARADFNRIRKNQFALVQQGKLVDAGAQVESGRELATKIEVEDTETVLNLVDPWSNENLDKKKSKGQKITLMKSRFGNHFMAVCGALGTPGRYVEVFKGRERIGEFATIVAFTGDQVYLHRRVQGRNEYDLFRFVKRLA